MLPKKRERSKKDKSEQSAIGICTAAEIYTIHMLAQIV
jgi:hypothetical protein